jgi:hypothetical protein
MEDKHDFSTLFIQFSKYLYRVRRGPLYHDEIVCVGEEGGKGGVWVPVNLVFLSMTSRDGDTALHVVNYSECNHFSQG